MRLWLKISIICIAVLLVVVALFSTLLLINSRDRIISIAVESTLAEQKDLSESFSQMVAYYGKEDIDPVAKRSLAQYCFKQFAAELTALKFGGETVYSNMNFEPDTYLSITQKENPEYYIGLVNEKNVLITGSQVSLLSDTYSVYLVRDVTEVYENISKMIWQFIVISIVSISIGTLLITALVRFYTRPLISLRSSAGRIAKGEYAERAKILTNDEIGDLAKDFNSMAEAIQSNYQEMKETTQNQRLFIGGLTHEFKTPLTSVIGHAETLLYTNMPKEMVDNSLHHIHEQCKWLERLTQKMLKLITLHEEIELKEESVSALLDAVKDNVHETLHKRGVTLETICDVKMLSMDFDLMLSLLVNLADNAAKASQQGQCIQIRAYDNIIEVKDQGVGIPKEELTRITEPFYMVDKSRSKKMGGSGLGLALVKKIAEAHGAQIEIESTLGLGTTIRVILPITKGLHFDDALLR